jgi:L-rhamnose mutarotase
MICPNLNDPLVKEEFDRLVAAVGKTAAYNKWYYYDGNVPESEYGVTQENIPTPIYSQKDRKESLKVAGISYLENVLENLSARFNLPYEIIFDENNPNKGYVDVTSYGTPTIVINGSKATHDTPLHEYAHIFINLIRSSNKNLYSNLIRQVLNTKEGIEELDKVKQYYSNYTLEEQIEETIVELLGKYAKNELDPETGIHKIIKQIWNTILEFLSTSFNVDIKDISPSTPIEQLAKLLSNPNANFNQESFIEQNLEVIREKNIKTKEKLEKDFEDFNKIKDPSVINTGSFSLVTNKEEFDEFTTEVDTIVTTLRNYKNTQLLTDIETIKSSIEDFDGRENFDYTPYPLFTKILPFIHPKLNVALYVLNEEIQKGTLDKMLEDRLKFLNEPLKEIVEELISGYGKSQGLGLQLPDFYKVSYPHTSRSSIDDIKKSFADKISEAEKIIQDPTQSDSYYNRSIDFATEDDTYSVSGSFRNGNINISFASKKHSMRDVNNSLFFKVLPKVIDSVSYMFSDLEYDSISFTPVTGNSSKGKDLRLKGYNIFAKRLFGQFSLVGQDENTTTIPIPEMFKNQMHIKQNMYQKSRETQEYIPSFKPIKPGVEYTFKSQNIILNNLDKIKGWEKQIKDLNILYKKIQELGIPKMQMELLINSNGNTIEEKLVNFLSNYSYTVEINIAKTNINSGGAAVQELDDIYVPSLQETFYFSYRDGWFKEDKNQDRIKATNEELKEIEKYKNKDATENSAFYNNLTVPGGTNYTENEIATPSITPDIKGHAQFATDNGIGWFRSDDASINSNFEGGPEDWTEGEPTKTRRILEVQSDLFQKGRNEENIINRNGILLDEKEFSLIPYEEYDEVKKLGKRSGGIGTKEFGYGIAYEYNGNYYLELGDDKYGKLSLDFINRQNQFLQLLNKDNNWVTFFVKSIIQDSAKKGYEKILFPSGNTASKVEGHSTLEEFKKQKEDRIKFLQEEQKRLEKLSDGLESFEDISYDDEGKPDGFITVSKEEELKRNSREIDQLKAELARVETEGFAALKPIYNFYENTVANVLKKQRLNPTLITDEYNNTWNEIDLSNIAEEDFIPSFKPKPSNTLSLIKQQEFKESLVVGEKAQPFLYWSQTTSKQVSEKDVIVDKILDDRFEGRYADTGEERIFKYSNVIDESLERGMTRNQQKFYRNNLVLGETIDVETQQETYRGEVVEIGEDEVQIQDVNGAIIAIPYNMIFKPNAQMKLAKVVQKLKETFSTQLAIYKRSPKSAEQQKRIESYEKILKVLEDYHQIEDFTVFLEEANKALFRAKTILDRVVNSDTIESNEKKLYVISYVKDLLNSFKNIKDLQTLINDFEGSEILKSYMAEFNDKLALAEGTYKDIAIPQLGSLLWEYYDPRLNDKMIEVGLEPYTKERLIDELSDPTRDIDFFNQVFVAPSNVDDVVMGLFVKMIKGGKEQARLQDARFLSNIVPLVEKLKKKYGLKKFKDILKTFYKIVPAVEEKDGEKRIINVREYIKKNDFTEYYEKSRELNERLNNAKARLAAAEAALAVEFTPEMNAERLNAQGEKLALGRELANFYNTYGIDITPEKFKKIMDNNYVWDTEIFYNDLAKYYSQVTDPDEVAELNPETSITIQNDITGEVEHYVRNAKPKSEPNPELSEFITDEWKALTGLGVDEDIKNLFLGLIEEFNAANRKLPYTRRIKDNRVPSIRKVDNVKELKTLWDKITRALAEGRLLSSIYNKIKNELSAFMKTGSPQYRRRMDGKPYREIPIGVTTVMDVEDSSDDIIMSTLMFVREANNFDSMNNFVGSSEVIIDVLTLNDPLDEEQKEDAIEVEINRRKEALLGFFKQQIYGEFNTTHGPLSKTIDFLGKATALTTIGLNPKSWLANFFVGNWANLAEGFGGRFYSVSDIWWADKEFMKMLRTEKGRTKLMNMINSLDAIQGRFTKTFGSELMTFKEKYGKLDTLFIGQDLAEIQIQGAAMLAMLKSQGIQVPEDGIFTEENTANLQDFKNLLHAINKRNHGVYNEFDRLHFQTNAVFRLFLQFRKWVVSTFRARYAGIMTGKYRVDIEMGSVEKGWYRLIYEYFRDSFADGKSLVQALKDINNPNLTSVQREGIRRSLVDFLAFVIGSSIIFAMTWGDDDDEEDFIGEYFIIYYLMRMVSEIGTYLPFLGFSDKLRMVANPFGAAGTLKDIIGFFGLIMDFEVDKDGNVSIFKEYQRDTGNFEKGDLKLWGKMSELAVISNFLEITDPKQLIENFEAASRM